MNLRFPTLNFCPALLGGDTNDQIVHNELFGAHIPSFQLGAVGEVARVLGVLQYGEASTFAFLRRSDFVAVKSNDFLPIDQASAFHRHWGQSVWAYNSHNAFISAQGVDCWSVWTLDGLRALSGALDSHFGERRVTAAENAHKVWADFFKPDRFK